MTITEIMTIADIESRYGDAVSSGRFRQPSGLHETTVMCSKCSKSYEPVQLSPLWYVAGWFADKYSGQCLTVEECYVCNPVQTVQQLWDVLSKVQRVLLCYEIDRYQYPDLYHLIAAGDRSSLAFATRAFESMIEIASCPVLLMATSHTLGPEVQRCFQAFIASNATSIRETGYPFFIFERLFIFIHEYKSSMSPQ